MWSSPKGCFGDPPGLCNGYAALAHLQIQTLAKSRVAQRRRWDATASHLCAAIVARAHGSRSGAAPVQAPACVKARNCVRAQRDPSPARDGERLAIACTLHYLSKVVGTTKGRKACAGLFACGGLSACLGDPALLPAAKDLSELYASYEQPTATLPAAVVPTLARLTQGRLQLARSLRGLGAVRTMIGDASAALGDRTGLIDDLRVDGRVEAVLGCPPDQALSPSAAAANGGAASRGAALQHQLGTLELALAVEDSRVLRAASGLAAACRLLVPPPGSPAQGLTFSGNLAVDFGTDLTIGDTLDGPLLVQASGIEATPPLKELVGDDYDLRLTADGSIESLFDLATLRVRERGTVVIGVSPDESLSIREKRGTWRCNAQGQSCNLAR